MFEKIKEAFEAFSQSYETNPDPTLRSVEVRMGFEMLSQKIIDILKSLKYKTIRYDDTFYEIFTKKAGYEVTISLTAAKSGTRIDISVYSPQNRGKTRKALRFLLHKMKEEFEADIVHE